METQNDPKGGRKYGRIGCVIALILLVIIIILIATGLINMPGSDGSVTG